MKTANKVLDVKSERKRELGDNFEDLDSRWENNIKTDIQ
jgi:hypothetical protein